MSSVLSRFTVRGRVSACSTIDQLTVTFAVLDNGSAVGAVVEPPSWFVVDPKASTDLAESTETEAAFTCRFALVHLADEKVVRGDVMGRLSQANGLIGRCTIDGQTHHIHLVPVDSSEADTPTSAPEPSAMDDELPGPTETRNVIFRGRELSDLGTTYSTVLFIKKAEGNKRIKGIAHNASRKCTLVGTWEGDSVRFQTAYPVTKNKVAHYDYVGEVEKTADSTRLVGTWQLADREKACAKGEGYTGTFDFTRDDSQLTRMTTRSKDHKNGV